MIYKYLTRFGGTSWYGLKSRFDQFKSLLPEGAGTTCVGLFEVRQEYDIYAVVRCVLSTLMLSGRAENPAFSSIKKKILPLDVREAINPSIHPKVFPYSFPYGRKNKWIQLGRLSIKDRCFRTEILCAWAEDYDVKRALSSSSPFGRTKRGVSS